MQMHIALIVIKFDLRNYNEISLTLFDMATTFIEMGHVVTILTSEVLGLPKDNPFEIIEVPMPKSVLGWDLFATTMHAFLRHHSYDIIHTVTPIESCDVYQPLSGFLANHLISKIATYGGGLQSKWKFATNAVNLRQRAEIKAQKTLCQQRGGPALVVSNQFLVKQFTELYAVNDKKIDVVGHGLTLDRYIDEEIKQKSVHLKKRFDPNNDTSIFIYITDDF